MTDIVPCKFKLSSHRFGIFSDKKISTPFCHDNTCDMDQFMESYRKSSDVPILCGLPSVNGSSSCCLHKCNMTECLEPISSHFGWDDDIFSKYCDKHTCHVHDCQNSCVGSDYCLQHKCQVCNKCAYTSPNYPATKYPFCQDHLTGVKCENATCSNMIEKTQQSDGTFQLMMYCEQHRCISCLRWEKTSETDYCRSCKCIYDGCTQPCLKNTENRGFIWYCPKHQAEICQFTFCKEKSCDTSSYCQEHSCKFMSCYRHIYSYDDEDGGYHSEYCYKHDLLDHLCKRYGFSLSDEQLMKCATTVNTPSSLKIQRKIPNNISPNDLLQIVTSNIARKAVSLCVKNDTDK